MLDFLNTLDFTACIVVLILCVRSLIKKNISNKEKTNTETSKNSQLLFYAIRITLIVFCIIYACGNIYRGI